ncbi:phosphatidylinositol glycan, class W, putative [Acanthamoeba castellanii str. Neff]|uniref:Phosphatidylinositol glycan, class W, putative n=1 Tax=Acanthamoeba castellanii (strain ATCC 30010 / Neff) TaxID=1257118 RepID=L8HA11_ACACF|nr:phosphatidylinositol glycan, class W, putative [Acanthamoeba castellanii str. Neff]ELR22369.1 phosphatidylinositol glycan, class W, putative [Acanthamoeba castellanii str. Neff]
MSSYKEEKEAFVSNLHGTSMGEVALVALTIPVTYLLHSVVVSLCSRSAPDFGAPLRFVVDFVCLVLPMLATFTMPHTVPLVFAGVLLLCAALDAYSRWRHNTSCFMTSGARDSDAAPMLVGKYKPFLSMYRTAMMLCTCIAILAVDFPIFPRRFAKTETYGTSLMDMGVGSFLLSNALVYRQTRRKSVVNLLLRMAPLLVLGCVRLLTVKSTDYQEHVTEYGVHWNFFFTLAAVSLLAGLCNVSEAKGAVYGLLLALAYQAALGLGLRDYILHAPRVDLLSQNKEGVFSAIGKITTQTSVWQWTQLTSIAMLLVDRKTRRDGWRLVMRLAALDVLLWVVTLAVDAYVEPSSRRMMNLTYVLSTLAQNLLTLCLVVLVSMLANLMVGLVNFSMKTLYAGDSEALGVLTGYMLAVCGLASVLHSFNITIKFW